MFTCYAEGERDEDAINGADDERDVGGETAGGEGEGGEERGEKEEGEGEGEVANEEIGGVEEEDVHFWP